ncbi:MAG: hypothetical protein ACI86M_002951 [Saprospiraceae bacterium]|jgi:hypothetical protein
MKTINMKNVYYLLFVALGFSCCREDPCRWIHDPAYTYQIRILDTSTEFDLLFGNQSIYNFDSIEYINSNVPWDLYKSEYHISTLSDTLLSLEMFRNTEEPYYLKLSNTDTDTIAIKITDDGIGCNGFTADSISLNGTDFVKYESQFVIWK